jgi:hypothetical protein
MKNKIRIGILGATGYTALELIKLLLRHPHAESTCRWKIFRPRKWPSGPIASSVVCHTGRAPRR